MQNGLGAARSSGSLDEACGPLLPMILGAAPFGLLGKFNSLTPLGQEGVCTVMESARAQSYYSVSRHSSMNSCAAQIWL